MSYLTMQGVGGAKGLIAQVYQQLFEATVMFAQMKDSEEIRKTLIGAFGPEQETIEELQSLSGDILFLINEDLILTLCAGLSRLYDEEEVLTKQMILPLTTMMVSLAKDHNITLPEMREPISIAG